MAITVENRQAKIGQIAPDFCCTAVDDEEFVEIKLKERVLTTYAKSCFALVFTHKTQDYRGQYVVLFFYPLDFTFVCPTEITAFSEAASDFEAELNTKVIAASTDSNFSHLAWINTDRLVLYLFEKGFFYSKLLSVTIISSVPKAVQVKWKFR